MKLDEVPAVLDVHPPHHPAHGVRDFFLHLFTITIGLLIALSLEGLVEWQHHRHLVHEAEASLHAEIAANAKDMQASIDDLHKREQVLKDDVVVLKYIVKNHKAPEKGTLDITFRIRGFQDVSWKTAQSTGALAYMPYDRAQQYADIYATQQELQAAQQLAARDAIIALGPFLNSADVKGTADPTEGETSATREKIEILQGQLLLIDSLMQALNTSYQKFLTTHPE